MNKIIFKKHLISSVEELQRLKDIKFGEYRFLINAVKEKDKPLNSTDDFMRLNILNQENLEGKYLKVEEVVNVLGGIMPLVPIWIELSFVGLDSDYAVLQLNCSMRFIVNDFNFFVLSFLYFYADTSTQSSKGKNICRLQ